MIENLQKYLFKNVVITDSKGNVIKGYVDFYESYLDSDAEEDSIGIVTNRELGVGVELYQSEIESISLE